MPEPRTMRPEDVPDELVALAWRAELARRAPEASAALVEEYCDLEAHPSMAPHREELRPVLAAVHPEIERQVRAKVGAEIAEPSVWADPAGRWTADQADAARAMKEHIVRRVERGEYGDARRT